MTSPARQLACVLLSTLCLVECATAQSPFGDPTPLLARQGELRSAAAGDFDGDGAVDVLRAGAPFSGLGAVHLFRGQPGGGLRVDSVVAPPGTNVTFLDRAVGDLDGNGSLDVLSSGPGSSSVAAFLNDGGGGFAQQQLPQLSGEWRDARFVRVNGDSIVDLLVTKVVNGVVTVGWVDGSGGLLTTPPVSLFTHPLFDNDFVNYQMLVTDIDGDGALDFVVGSHRSHPQVAYGSATGAVSALTDLTIGGAGSTVFVAPTTFADLDGDGAVDMLGIRNFSAQWFRGVGAGSFAPGVQISASAGFFETSETEVMDLDADGDLDVVADSIVVMLQTSPGTFTDVGLFDGETEPGSSFADLNGDGLEDLVLENVEGMQWRLGGAGTGTGFFGSLLTTNSGLSTLVTHTLDDLDGDGAPDIVVASRIERTIFWFRNLGGGAFDGVAELADLDRTPTDVLTLDLEGDGDLDLVVPEVQAPDAELLVETFRSDGAGQFVSTGNSVTVPLASTSPRPRVEVADFNGDANPDLMIHDRAQLTGGLVHVYLGDGLGNFTATPQAFPPATDVITGDFDGDGIDDLVRLESGPNRITLWINQGNGTLVEQLSVPWSFPANALSVADVNADGALDVFVSGFSGLHRLLGTGTGQLGAPSAGDPYYSSSPRFEDIDLDGRLDVYSFRRSSSRVARWKAQDANGGFPGQDFMFDDPRLNNEWTRLADVDGDGDLDAVVGHMDSFWGPTLRLHLNETLSTIGSVVCAPQTPNSSGAPGQLDGFGSDRVDVNSLRLDATQLPANRIGMFVGSRALGSPMPLQNSMGLLCLTGSLGRYQGPGQIQSSGPDGAISLELDLTQLTTSTGLVQGQPGETWHFQLWHRDVAAGVATSHLTTGLQIMLR